MSADAKTAPSMTAYEWSMLLTLSAVWGGSFFFNEVAVRELPVFTVVVSRVFLAALVLLVVMRIAGESLPRTRPVWLAFFAMGFINNVIPFTLIVWGQQHLASGVAAILNAATPLFTVLCAHFLLSDERMSAGKLAGVIIGFVGVAVMIGPGALLMTDMTSVAPFLCLAAALSYAFAGVFGRRFRTMGVTPLATASGQVIASSTMLLPLVLIIDAPWTLPPPSLQAVLALIGVATLSTAFGYILYFRILATAGATNLLLVTFLIPVSAILLGVAFLQEVLLPKHFLGMALIGLGLAAIDGRPLRSIRSRIGRTQKSGDR